MDLRKTFGLKKDLEKYVVETILGPKRFECKKAFV